MMKPIIVTIYGNVGSGKSPWAAKIKELANKRGLSAIIIDHNLFLFDKKYEDKLTEAKKYIHERKPDFGVLVVGTGNDRTPFKIEIEPFGHSSIAIMDLLCGNELL